MKRLSDIAIKECVAELRAACRLPIEEHGLDVIVAWLRPNFERILDCPEGRNRWADFGQRMRDNGRYLGTFADFFASHAETTIVGLDELKRAFTLVRADCTVRTERTPVAWEFCPNTPLDASPAEAFLRAVAPAPEPV
ncbi:MAG: hypothetical protein ABR606_18535 [Vicinamibacterales bacterium]